MAKSDLINSINLLSKKIDRLLEERNVLLLKIQELQKENRDLKIQAQNNAIIIENSRKDIEFLSLSYRLADSPEALVEARKEISSLLRTIDSCIRILKED